MSSEKPNEASIFNVARKIESSADRDAYVTLACRGDAVLRGRVNRLLSAFAAESQFLEHSAPELQGAIVVDPSNQDRAGALQAGLAAAFEEDQTLVIGSAGQSVLKTLEQTWDKVPRVALRDAAEEGAEPIVWPKSAEMPQRDSDSRYQLQGEIARGGMGAILKGRDIDLGRDLAIKVLLDQHKDKPDVIQRFVEEAQIGGQLQHPGVAPIYELGQFADKRPFFAMKLVKGETLSKLLADRADPAVDRGRFVGIFEQICQTMAYAHSRGVIHRDLKPANIMVGAFGEVQVMDWGLAKVLSAGGIADEKKAHDKQRGHSIIQTLRSGVGSDVQGTFGTVGSQTQMGSVMGTPAYMPPEQALGEIDNLDERADVFGLGAILCEILTGKPPYVGDDGTQVYRLASRGKLSDCFERLDACGADGELIAIAKQCLELEPRDRPRDAGVLAARVSAHLASVETRLRATELERAAEAARAEEALLTVAETEARARAERRARRLQLMMAAVVLVLVSVGGLAAFRSATVQRTLKDEALRAERKADEARQEAEQAARREQALAQEAQDLQQRESELRQQAEVREQTMQATLYAAEMNLAGQAADDPAGLRRVGQITANWGPDRATRDLRGWEWSYLVALQHPDQMTIEDPHASCIAWHPGGTWFATGGRDGRVRVWEAATGKLSFELTSDTGYFHFIAWSPKGDRIAAASHDQTVRVWDSVTRESCAPVQRLGAVVNSVCWSPDGQEIAANAGASVVISNVETGLPVKTFEVLDRESGVAWHPSQPRVALYQSVFDINTGAKLWSHPGDRMEWSPDGQRMAVAAAQTAYIVSGEDGKVLFELSGHADRIHQIVWSPAGTEVATGGRDNTLRVWDAQSGKLLATLRGHTDWVLGVAWSPDGKRLASVSKNAVKLWNWPHRSNPARLKMERPGVAEVVWSPDGTTLAAVHDRFESWNVDTLERKSVVDLGAGGLETGFSPAVSWNSAAQLIAARRNEGAVLLDDQTGEVRLKIPNVDTHLRSMALSPDGTRLATSAFQQSTANEGDGGILRLYDTATGQQVWAAKHHGDTAGSLAWSPDGSRIAVGGWTMLAVVDASTGEILAKNSADYSTGWIHEIAWSPTGDHVALAHFDHSVRIVDAKQGIELRVLVGHTSDVRAVSWSSDGSRIASGGHDQTVRIWNTQSGLQMLVLQGHQATVESIQWSPDGKTLASGGSDGEVRIWDARVDPSRQLIATARRPIEPAALEEVPLSPADIERELVRLTSELEADHDWLVAEILRREAASLIQ